MTWRADVAAAKRAAERCHGRVIWRGRAAIATAAHAFVQHAIVHAADSDTAAEQAAERRDGHVARCVRAATVVDAEPCCMSSCMLLSLPTIE